MRGAVSPKALRISQRGECETRVTGDEWQWTLGSLFSSFSPSFAGKCSPRERETSRYEAVRGDKESKPHVKTVGKTFFISTLVLTLFSFSRRSSVILDNENVSVEGYSNLA